MTLVTGLLWNFALYIWAALTEPHEMKTRPTTHHARLPGETTFA